MSAEKERLYGSVSKGVARSRKERTPVVRVGEKTGKVRGAVKMKSSQRA